MLSGRAIVLDMGKSNVKASLWDVDGRLLAREVRANQVVTAGGYASLDVGGIDEWLGQTLRRFASLGPVASIMPVGHGAAAALVHGNRLFAAPLDYEYSIPDVDLDTYRAQRDPFAQTGSPCLPSGLNLGAQLHFLERVTGPWPKDLRIAPWPQYWAWRLSGVLASEITSLGCHTDLWKPFEREFSDLARRRGWDERFAPMRSASESLGRITDEWAERTGLPKSCHVHCGLHDSNAALVAARGCQGLADGDLTIVSTGTWFVAMRSPAPDARIDMTGLHGERDCLVNADVHGKPVPSARFMGGREAQILAALEAHPGNVGDLAANVSRLVRQGACAYPSFVAGVGPFPKAPGTWVNKPTDPRDLWAVTQLYLALMTDAVLDLVGSRGQLLLEGRFAHDEVFTRALASLRPAQKIYACNDEVGVAYGALRLLDPTLPAPTLSRPMPALETNLRSYADQWRAHVGRTA